MVHAVGTLCGYAFLTRRGDSKVFDMHSLVHLATRIWIQGEGRTATTKEKAHRGLGLALAYGIVTNHGGGVAISSLPGAGVSARVYLPPLGPVSGRIWEPEESTKNFHEAVRQTATLSQWAASFAAVAAGLQAITLFL